MPHAKVNGINLYYEEYGSGPALVMTHGYAGTTRMWQPQVEAFSKEHRFIVYDMRGHGRSDSPADRALYSWDIAIEDLHQLLRRLGVREAIIGGLSLGGLVTLHYYQRHPENTRALILADTGPGFRNPESRARWDREHVTLSEDLEKRGIEAFMVNPAAKDSYYTPPDLMRTQNPIGLSNVNLALQTKQEMVPLEDVKRPTLVVVGQNDINAIPPSNYMHRKIQGSRMAVIPQAGHGSNVDNPTEFNRALVDFMKDNGL